MRLGLIVMFAAFISCGSINYKIKNSNNMVVAHRGAWKQDSLPQNSIASLKRAIELKCAGSEFDVRMTYDNVLVVFHDARYNGLLIEDTKYEELLKFKLSNGEKVPTLKEYILAAKNDNSSTGLICEIKPSKYDGRGVIIAQKVVELIENLKATPYVAYYISFDYSILKRISEISKTKTQYLNGDKSPDEVKADGISGIDYYLNVFRKHPEWIKNAKENGIILNAWTVNTPEDLDWLINSDFDFITTDEPELLLEMVAKMKTK